MTDEPVAVGEVRWLRLFPWLRLFGGVGLAIDAPKLILAALGLVLLSGGWRGLDRVFSGSVGVVAFDPLAQPEGALARGRGGVAQALAAAPWRVAEPPLVLLAPFRHVFAAEADRWTFLHAAAAALWGVLVWGIVGGAIARIAVLQATGHEPVGMFPALRFAVRHWEGLIGAPLGPFVAVAICAALCALFASLYRIPASFGPIAAGALLFLPLLAGLVMAVILAGLALAWPLMHASTAAEGEREDFFDALSRSYSYVNQRSGRYVAYAAVAWLMGVLGLVVVDLFAWLVVHLAHWGLSFGAPGGRHGSLWADTVTATDAEPTAAALHGLWLTVVGLLAHGWIYSYFWTATTLIYLLLRLDVDGVPWSVVQRAACGAGPAPAPFASVSSLPPSGAPAHPAEPDHAPTISGP
jgi:hypothetical protein